MDVEWQDGQVYLHVGARRKEPSALADQGKP
jgi:hypothetical protein